MAEIENSLGQIRQFLKIISIRIRSKKNITRNYSDNDRDKLIFDLQ